MPEKELRLSHQLIWDHLSICVNQEVASEAYAGTIKSTTTVSTPRTPVINIQDLREAERIIHQSQTVAERISIDQRRRSNATTRQRDNAHGILSHSIRGFKDKSRHRSSSSRPRWIDNRHIHLHTFIICIILMYFCNYFHWWMLTDVNDYKYRLYEFSYRSSSNHKVRDQ